MVRRLDLGVRGSGLEFRGSGFGVESEGVREELRESAVERRAARFRGQK
jgi:hypothetical protein